MLWKCCTQYASKFGKLSSGHRTGKGVFIPIPKEGNAKEFSNYYTIALIHTLIKIMLKILQASLQQYVNWELPNVQSLKRQRNQRSNCQYALNHRKKQESSRKKKNLLLLYWLLESLWLCGSQQAVEYSSRDWNTRPPYLLPEKSVCRSRNNS